MTPIPLSTLFDEDGKKLLPPNKPRHYVCASTYGEGFNDAINDLSQLDITKYVRAEVCPACLERGSRKLGCETCKGVGAVIKRIKD